jgi:hypothetical protein
VFLHFFQTGSLKPKSAKTLVKKRAQLFQMVPIGFVGSYIYKIIAVIMWADSTPKRSIQRPDIRVQSYLKPKVLIACKTGGVHIRLAVN